MGDLQQRGLFTRAGFNTLVEALFCMDSLADIPDNPQLARSTLVGECTSRAILHKTLSRPGVRAAPGCQSQHRVETPEDTP